MDSGEIHLILIQTSGTISSDSMVTEGQGQVAVQGPVEAVHTVVHQVELVRALVQVAQGREQVRAVQDRVVLVRVVHNGVGIVREGKGRSLRIR